MKTNDLLNEWKNFLNENRIIPLAELVDIIKSSTSYSNNDVDQFTKFWNSNQFSSKYSQVIKNDLEKGEPIAHIVDAVILHYEKVYQSASPKIKSDIGSGAYSVDDLRKDLDERLDSNKFNSREIRQQCQYQNGRPVVGEYKDFNVVYSESDWIVIDPKTKLASIAWAHGKPDGSEETDQARRVGWCTATTSENNMFPNYAGNMHMFYLIKSNYDSDNSPERRLCLSYVVSEGKAQFSFNNATVDADNRSIKSVDHVRRIVSKNVLDLLDSLVSSRKETSFAEIYSKITLPQLIRQVQQMNVQRIDPKDIETELVNYITCTKSKDVVSYLLQENESNVKFRAGLASNKNLPEIDTTRELTKKLVNDKEHDVVYQIGVREDLLKLDPSGGLVRKFYYEHEDRTDFIVFGHLLKLDPSGDLLRDLANDPNPYASGATLQREDIAELDDAVEIIRKKIDEGDEIVLEHIAERQDLLKIDPSGDLLRKLANCGIDIVVEVLYRNKSSKEYLDFLNSAKNESILRDYIKLIMS